MKFKEEFLILLKARYPIIYIVTIEEDRLEYTIRKILHNRIQRNIYIWDFIDGYSHNPISDRFGKRNPLEALEFIEFIQSKTPSIFILKDYKRFLKDILISRKLRNLLQLLKIQPKTIIFIDSQIEIPIDLRDYITILHFSLPTAKEIKDEIKRLTRKLQLKGQLSSLMLEKIVQACQGLSLQRIRRVLGKSLAIFKKIDQNSIDLILQEKKQIIGQTELLEFWSTKEKLINIGGAYNLKKWLKTRADTFSEKAINYGLTTPKGILLIGMHGSGKSLIAKAISFEWRLPLLRLDIGRLFGGIVGESESRVRQMITIVESLSPCILWIDEMDKGFTDSEQNSDNGTTSRVLSTFITWLSEKTCSVFVIATANDLHSLPIEILRKGRFDEIFFLGTPTIQERYKIFEIHLKRFRPDTWYKFDIQKLGVNSSKFSGSEIEQTIIDAMYNAFSERREFTTNDILSSIHQTVPILEIDPIRTELIQSWMTSGRIRLA